MTYNVFSGTLNPTHCSALHCHFLFVVCSSNVFILHRFRDIATFAVYMTSGDLDKTFSFVTLEITCHLHFPIRV